MISMTRMKYWWYSCAGGPATGVVTEPTGRHAAVDQQQRLRRPAVQVPELPASWTASAEQLDGPRRTLAVAATQQQQRQPQPGPRR